MRSRLRCGDARADRCPDRLAAAALSRRSAILVVGAIAVVRLFLQAAADRADRLGDDRAFRQRRMGDPHRVAAFAWRHFAPAVRHCATGISGTAAHCAVVHARLSDPARHFLFVGIDLDRCAAALFLGAGAFRFSARAATNGMALASSVRRRARVRPSGQIRDALFRHRRGRWRRLCAVRPPSHVQPARIGHPRDRGRDACAQHRLECRARLSDDRPHRSECRLDRMRDSASPVSWNLPCRPVRRLRALPDGCAAGSVLARGA